MKVYGYMFKLKCVNLPLLFNHCKCTLLKHNTEPKMPKMLALWSFHFAFKMFNINTFHCLTWPVHVPFVSKVIRQQGSLFPLLNIAHWYKVV